MDALQGLAPRWGTLEQWNGAFEKVEDYLRSYRVDSRLQRARITQRVLAAVATRPEPPDPAVPGLLETWAIEECRRLMLAWFGDLAASAARVDEAGIDARVALLVSDAPLRWPYAFMEPGRMPDEMRQALRVSALRAGPDVSISHMVPRAIDMGFLPELAGGPMATFARWPLLKTLLAWTIYLLILAALFWVTRR